VLATSAREPSRVGELEAQVTKLRRQVIRIKQAKDKLQTELSSKAGQVVVLSESLEALQHESRGSTQRGDGDHENETGTGEVDNQATTTSQDNVAARALVLTVQLVNALRQQEQTDIQIQGMS
jgi:hypothetical protein